jgi:hypothetical protein
MLLAAIELEIACGLEVRPVHGRQAAVSNVE